MKQTFRGDWQQAVEEDRRSDAEYNPGLGLFFVVVLIVGMAIGLVLKGWLL